MRATIIGSGVAQVQLRDQERLDAQHPRVPNCKKGSIVLMLRVRPAVTDAGGAQDSGVDKRCSDGKERDTVEKK
eukprot:441794-Pelagomonas_calceolata.AAC.3